MVIYKENSPCKSDCKGEVFFSKDFYFMEILPLLCSSLLLQFKLL